MEELKIKKVIISVQSEYSENYEKFKNIANSKKINILFVKKGDKLKIERNIFLDFLWPDNQNLIRENSLNNNSIVCKFNYKNCSILFTGDIEEIAEKQILDEYRNNLVLNATILKVGHHGSKTSSSKEFINEVKPKIALIGVGKNNKFGHPSEEVVNRLETSGCKIYCTDLMGEIIIIIDKNEKIVIKRMISEHG